MTIKSKTVSIENLKVIISTAPNSDWDQVIWKGIHQRHLEENAQENTFERFSIYAKCHTSDSLIVGGSVLERQGDILRIDALWVDPMVRKQGIGTKILDQIMDMASSFNCRAVQLNTYFKENLSFYTQNGFEEVVCIPQWKYGLDCYFMRKGVSLKP